MEKGEGGSIRGATEEKANVDTQNDLPLLTDEKFDFDLSLSSSSANEDDEVFFGLVGHRERCVAASLELQGLVPREAEQPLTWSPPAGEKFLEIFKEAHLLALQIASSSKKSGPRAGKPKPEPEPVPALGLGEEFVKEARLKLDIFERGLQVQKGSPALKRETYFVLSPEAAPVQASLSFAESPGASEPTSSACLQTQGTVERKTMSQLQPPKSLSVPGKGALAKLQPGKQTHPSRHHFGNSRVSSGAVSSGASEMSVSSVSGSSITKGPHGLPAPSKFGARKTLLKPTEPTRTFLGGKSASFSGPVCNMSLTLSSSSVGTPARGSAKSGDPFPCLADTPRPKSSIRPSHRNISCPAARFAGQTQESASVSLRQPQTPRAGMQRPSSTPSLSQASRPTKSRVSGGPSSGAKVGPRHPAFPGGTSLDSATPRVQGMSQLPSGPLCGSTTLHGTPARCFSGGALQPLSSSTCTPLSGRRLSALPTLSRRQASTLPSWPTPRTCPRAASPPRLADARPPAQVLPKKAEGRPKQAQERSGLGASSPSDPLLGVPLALNFASPKPTAPGTPEQEAKDWLVAKPAPAEALLIHLGPETCTTVPATPKPPLRGQPLIDFSNSPEVAPRWLPLTPAKVTTGQGQLLIDLFHSPEVTKGIPSKPPPAMGQLIDLSSPLISLSPCEDKENLVSPLLKF